MSELIKLKQVSGLQTALDAKALDSAVVKKSNNLSDINAASARTNLGIYSQAEVNSLIAGAENARSVADNTARNALTGLKVTDRVFVTNDGDNKWALYLVTAITNGNGSTSTFVKVADEDIFSNAISASAVKTAYESNANTNAYTDAEKTKVGHLTVTQAVNLDTMESGLATTTTTANNALSTANSATSAAASAQTTANTAVSNAATAQTTANGAVSDAAAAQSTADDAATAAAGAQSTANTAVSNAATAQTTATNALNAANSKEAAFTLESQDFTGLTGGASTPIAIDLAHPVASGFEPLVFFNGLQVKTITYTPGANQMTYTVPYVTEVDDVITVSYCYN
jgi:hypothetical protein